CHGINGIAFRREVGIVFLAAQSLQQQIALFRSDAPFGNHAQDGLTFLLQVRRTRWLRRGIFTGRLLSCVLRACLNPLPWCWRHRRHRRNIWHGRWGSWWDRWPGWCRNAQIAHRALYSLKRARDTLIGG